MTEKKSDSIPRSAFAKGGKATLKKYGKKHFVNLAKKRWAKRGARKSRKIKR